MKCNICLSLVHVKCIPFLTKKDSVYTERENNNWICSKCIGGILPFNHITEDDDFVHALAENWWTDPLIPLDLLYNDDRVFQPFELNFDENMPLGDIDPDIQFYHNQYNNNLISSDYHLEESFNKKNF